MRKVVFFALAAIFSTVRAANADVVDCKILPRDLPSRMTASDPTFIRRLIFLYASKCTESAAAGSDEFQRLIATRKDAPSRANLSLALLERRISFARRDAYRTALKDFTEDGRLSEFAQGAAATGGLSMPAFAASVTNATQALTKRTLDDDNTKDPLNQSRSSSIFASATINSKSSDRLYNIYNLASNETAILQTLIDRNLHNLKNLMAFDYNKAFIFDAGKKKDLVDFDYLGNYTIFISGKSLHLSTIIEDIKSEDADLTKTRAALIAIIGNENKSLTTLDAIKMIVGGCAKNRACLDRESEQSTELGKRLRSLISNQKSFIIATIKKDYFHKKGALGDLIRLKIGNTISEGVLRSDTLSFLQLIRSHKTADANTIKQRAILLIQNNVQFALKNRGLDKETADIIDSIACSKEDTAPLFDCNAKGPDLKDLGQKIIALTPEGSPERAALTAIIENRSLNNESARPNVDLDAIISAIGVSLEPAIREISKSIGDIGSTPPSEANINEALSIATRISIINTSTRGIEQLVDSQNRALETFGDRVASTKSDIDKLNSQFEVLRKKANEYDINRELSDANKEIQKIRSQISIGASELQLIQSRVFSASTSFDERLDGIRMLTTNSSVSTFIPNEIKNELGKAVEIGKRAELAWNSMSSAYDNPDASSIGAALNAISLLTDDENLKNNLQTAGSALQLYSAATTIFAASNPAGMALAGFSFLSGGGGGIFGGGGGGGLFGGGSSGPDPAILAELHAIQQSLNVIDKKIDQVLALQHEALRRLDNLSVQISRNQAEVLQTLFEVRSLQEQTIERLNFYGASWTRECNAVGTALETVGAFDIAHPSAWKVLRANVDAVVGCISGMQTFLQNARDGKTYATRQIASILNSAIEGCRAKVNGADSTCDRYKDWSVDAYERSFNLARELGLAMAPVVDDPKKERDAQDEETQRLRHRYWRFVWELTNPATDVHSLDARTRRYRNPGNASPELSEDKLPTPPEPFTAAICGELPRDIRSARNVSTYEGSVSDRLDSLNLMANAISPEWIADHVKKTVQYHPLINFRPYLRDINVNLDLTAPEPHREGAWALLCSARMALQIAIAQQVLISGDALLPRLYDAIVANDNAKASGIAPSQPFNLLELPVGRNQTNQEAHKQRREVIFETFQRNRLLARNFVAYLLVQEFEKFAADQAKACKATSEAKKEPNLPCLKQAPRNVRAYELARITPTLYGADGWHRCGDKLFGSLPRDNEQCAMTVLFPRLRGEPGLTGNRESDIRGEKDAQEIPLLRYSVRPFIIREMIGQRPVCRFEPGQNWYFVWAKTRTPPSEDAKQSLLVQRGSNINAELRPSSEGEPKTKWEADQKSKITDACENFTENQHADPKGNKWLFDIVKAEDLFVSPLPSALEVGTAIFKHPPILLTLLKLERQVIEAQQALRDLSPATTGEQAEARRLFIFSTLASLSPRRPITTQKDQKPQPKKGRN